MVAIKSSNTVELSSDSIDKVIGALEVVTKKTKSKKLKSADDLMDNLVDFEKKKGKKEQEQAPVSDILTKLNHDDIVKGAIETHFGHELKTVKGTIIYKFGGFEDAPEREIDLTIKVDYDTEKVGHLIVLGGKEYSKLDFNYLYSAFDTICSKAISIMVKAFNENKQNLRDNKQIEMFPELEKSYLGSFTLSVDIFNNIKGDSERQEITVVAYNENNFCLQIDKKTFLHKSDIYFFYYHFDNIVEKILGSNS